MVVTDSELVGVALAAWHLHNDPGVGTNASSRITPTAPSNVRLSVRLSVCPSVRSSVCLSVCLSVLRGIYTMIQEWAPMPPLESLQLLLPTYVCLSVCLSVCPSVQCFSVVLYDYLCCLDSKLDAALWTALPCFVNQQHVENGCEH